MVAVTNRPRVEDLDSRAIDARSFAILMRRLRRPRWRCCPIGRSGHAVHRRIAESIARCLWRHAVSLRTSIDVVHTAGRERPPRSPGVESRRATGWKHETGSLWLRSTPFPPPPIRTSNIWATAPSRFVPHASMRNAIHRHPVTSGCGTRATDPQNPAALRRLGHPRVSCVPIYQSSKSFVTGPPSSRAPLRHGPPFVTGPLSSRAPFVPGPLRPGPPFVIAGARSDRHSSRRIAIRWTSHSSCRLLGEQPLRPSHASRVDVQNGRFDRPGGGPTSRTSITLALVLGCRRA